MNCLVICMICLFISPQCDSQLSLLIKVNSELMENAHRPQLHLLCLFVSLILTTVCLN